MEQLNGKLVKYTHPASPPLDIELNKIYTIVYDNKNIFIYNGNYKQDIKFELLKQLFSLVDGDWDELLKDEIKIEEIKIDVSKFEKKKE